jgi:transcription antitermination factor NusA-like protein
MAGSKQEILDELLELERRVDEIKESLKAMRSQAEESGSVTKEHLDLTVERVDDLQRIMGQRQDVGH